MKFRRSPWLLAVIALVFNLGGSPMAWANLLGDGAAAPSIAATAECHGHEAAEPAPAPDSMPCCEDGSCSCVATVLVVHVSPMPARPPHPGFIAPADTSALPAHPLDDDLRPPIR